MGRGALLAALVSTAACGLTDFPSYMPPGASDVTCFDDADCAPNGCCGEGTAVVHVTEAPDCSAVRCSGACPLNAIRCGCGVPLCRDSRCVAAVSTAPECP